MSVNEKMTAIADAIRAKTGGTEPLTLDGMAKAIAGIQAGDGDYTNEQIAALLTRTVTDFPFPDGITSIGGYVFQGCSALVLTELPDTLKSIGQNAFANCSSICIKRIPDNVALLGKSAFYYCSGIEELSLPGGLQMLQGTFSGCSSLAKVTFRGTVTSMHAQTFTLCPNLLTINVPWAEGEVANAPWGATNATINYSYTEA